MNRRVALLLAAALLAASCGGHGTTGPLFEGQPGTVEALFGEGNTFVNIRLEVPTGWHALDVPGRIILAEHEADLNSSRATGSRLTVEPAVLGPADAAMTMLPPGSGDTGAMRIVTEPQGVGVAGFPAVDVTIEDTSGPIPYIRRYLVIYYGRTTAAKRRSDGYSSRINSHSSPSIMPVQPVCATSLPLSSPTRHRCPQELNGSHRSGDSLGCRL